MADDPQLVLIEWIDSGRPIPGWQRLSDFDSRRTNRCVSVGFLIQDDEDTKVVAPNLGSSNGDAAWDQASGLIRIPAASITKMKHLTAFSISSIKRRPLADAQWLRRLA